jgi:hypothetical protein
VSQEECARRREGVPYGKVYRYNPKHLCPKLNSYGDNGHPEDGSDILFRNVDSTQYAALYPTRQKLPLLFNVRIKILRAVTEDYMWLFVVSSIYFASIFKIEP